VAEGGGGRCSACCRAVFPSGNGTITPSSGSQRGEKKKKREEGRPGSYGFIPPIPGAVDSEVRGLKVVIFSLLAPRREGGRRWGGGRRSFCRLYRVSPTRKEIRGCFLWPDRGGKRGRGEEHHGGLGGGGGGGGGGGLGGGGGGGGKKKNVGNFSIG